MDILSQFKKMSILVFIVALCFCAGTGNAFAANCSLTVCDTSLGTSEEGVDNSLNEMQYFKFEAKLFNSYIAKGCEKHMADKCWNKKELEKKFKQSFKNTTSKSTNLIYLAGHGSKNGVLWCGAAKGKKSYCYSVSPREIRLWCDKHIKGKTIIFTEQCYGGVFARDFMKQNASYTKKHYAVLTCTDKTSNYALSCDYWFSIRDKYKGSWTYGKLADANNDGKLTISEWYNFCRQQILCDNIACDKKVDSGRLYAYGSMRNIVIYKIK